MEVTVSATKVVTLCHACGRFRVTGHCASCIDGPNQLGLIVMVLRKVGVVYPHTFPLTKR